MATVKVQSSLTYQNSSAKIEMWKVWMKISIECKEKTAADDFFFKKTWYVKAETVEKCILHIISGISNPTHGDGKISEHFDF